MTMASSIVPVAKSIFLCDYHVGYRDGKVDLYGLFNAIRPRNGYPHIQGSFCAFAQLSNGFGQVQFFLDLRSLETDELVWTSETHELSFPHRTAVVQMAMTVEGCQFEHPGMYALALFCNNTSVCDTLVLLR
jgi:hypothetical protein